MSIAPSRSPAQPRDNNGASANGHPPSKTVVGRALGSELNEVKKSTARLPSKDGVGIALTDTPLSTAPSSPQM